MISHETSILLAKSFSAGAIAALIDSFHFKNGIKPNILFGVGTGVAVFTADMLAKHSPLHAGKATHVAKSLEARALELGLGASAAIFVDTHFVESFSSSLQAERLATVVFAEIFGEYVANSFLLMG